MQNFSSLGYMLHVLLKVSANFSDNPRTTQNTLFIIILELIPMYTLVSEVHVCIKVI